MQQIIRFGSICLRFLPFILLCFLLLKVNLPKAKRNRQVLMPVIAFLYGVLLLIEIERIAALLILLLENLYSWLQSRIPFLANLGTIQWEYWILLIVNTALVLLFMVGKRIIITFMNLIGGAIEKVGKGKTGFFYEYDEDKECYFLKNKYGQLKKIYTWFYYAAVLYTTLILILSYFNQELNCFQYRFYPVFGIILLAEIVSYLNGLTKVERGVQEEKEKPQEIHVDDYTGLREKYIQLYRNRILTDRYEDRTEIDTGTTEEIISQLRASSSNIEKAFGDYLNREVALGTEISGDYILSSVSMLHGESVLFANPFYHDLTACIYFPFNISLLRYGKGLIITGRHGIEEEISEWAREGFESVCHVPSFWKTGLLTDDAQDLDIGILSLKDIYNTQLLADRESFLQDVTFVLLLEPSRIIAGSQIALSILARRIEKSGKKVVYCACDKNADGLVDSLSHILKTNLTEVRATVASAQHVNMVYWKADGPHMHHKIYRNIVKYLGCGISIASVALKHGISKIHWYSDEKFPVRDIRWIAGQYFAAICKYIERTVSQETVYNSIGFENSIWSAKTEKEQCLIVEDEYCNLFEMGRQFATRGKEQVFVNILSSNYMMRDYMSTNAEIFQADPKAIPQIVPDYARTRRNCVIQLIMMLTNAKVSDKEIRTLLATILTEEKITRDYLEKLIQEFYDTIEYGLVVRELRSEDEYERSTQEIVRRRYFTIDNAEFIRDCAADLQNAYYLAEDDVARSHFLGGKLMGHVYQSFLPGQFHTLAGKYYEIVGIHKYEGELKNAVIVRRAADHISGRKYYRQLKTWNIGENGWMTDPGGEGLRKLNGISIYSGYVDLSIETAGYMEMSSYNDFKTAVKVEVSDIPDRSYTRKYALRIVLPDADSQIRLQITLMLNELFRTLFPDCCDYITAVTNCEEFENLHEGVMQKLTGYYDPRGIYIFEDSQIDLGLLIAVDRNLKKLFEIICDYLDWSEQLITEKKQKEEEAEAAGESEGEPEAEPSPESGDDGPVIEFDTGIEEEIQNDIEAGEGTGEDKTKGKKKGIGEKIKGFFGKKKKKKPDGEAEAEPEGGDAGSGADGTGTGGEPGGGSAADGGTDTGSAGTGSDAGTGAQETGSGAAEEPAAGTSDSTPKTAEEGEFNVSINAPLPRQTHGVVNVVNVTETSGITDDDVEPEDDEPKDGEFDALEFHYLKYGFDSFPDFIQVEKVHNYLSKLGFDNNSYKKTRYAVKGVEEIERTYDPRDGSKMYCDFCGCDITGQQHQTLADGRKRCETCSATAVNTLEDFKKIFLKVQKDMEAYFSINMNIPIKVKMVSAKKLAKEAGSKFVPTNGFDPRCVGLAVSDWRGYTLYVENGAPKDNVEETVCHELTHIWQYKNWNRNRILQMYGKNARKEVYEGMAVWVSIQYMMLLNKREYAKRLEIASMMRDDEYGRGFRLYAKKYSFSPGQHIDRKTPFQNVERPL